jgi:hypothetical protein
MVMAATLAGIGIALGLVVTQSWLRWVMIDAALIAFLAVIGHRRGTRPAAGGSPVPSRVAQTFGWFRDLRQISAPARHTNPSRMSARLVADLQPPVAHQPGQRPLYHIAVPAQLVAGLDPAPSDPGRDSTLAQRPPTARVVVALVAMELGGPLAGPTGPSAWALDRRDRVHQLLQQHGVVGVGRRQPDRQRDATAVHQQVVLGPGLAAVCRVRAGQLAPRLARTLSESRQARDQSSWPSRPSWSSSAWWSCCQPPARCQSRSRRQQVTGCRSRAHQRGAAATARRCAAGRRSRPGRRGRRRGVGRRSGVAEWAAAAGWPATTCRARGYRTRSSWPRIMPVSKANSKNQPKVGNTLL